MLVNILRMIDDYLFGNSYPYGQKDPNRNKVSIKSIRPFLKFNSNKILHGEDIYYGTINNLIRCYLILDFLYHFSQKINGAQIT